MRKCRGVPTMPRMADFLQPLSVLQQQHPPKRGGSSTISNALLQLGQFGMDALSLFDTTMFYRSLCHAIKLLQFEFVLLAELCLWRLKLLKRAYKW